MCFSARATNLSKAFGGTGLGTVKDGDLLLAVVDFGLLRLHNQRLGKIRELGRLLAGRAPPEEHDDAADEDCHGRREYHQELPILDQHR